MTSRFLRKSTRRQIRDFDNFQNVYPNLRRSSDQTNLTFNNQSPFDDTRTIRFGIDEVSFPSMAPLGYEKLPSSSIFLSNLTKIRPTAQEYKPNLPGNKQSLPFNETRLDIKGTQEYISTSSVYRTGFKSPIRNKIAITIDISSNETKTLFKLSSADTIKDPQGPFYGSGSTGFVYYNFKEKRWEDIGLTAQYRGHLGDASSLILTGSGYNIYPSITGTDYYMSQFRTTSQIIGAGGALYNWPPGTTASLDEVNTFATQWRYAFVGSPTSFFGAPYEARYHATSSQYISLKDYIDQPFVLEEIEYTIPISATRTHGAQPGPFNPARGSLRDIENMMFFMYRQKGDTQSLSKRNLFSYSAVSFYNAECGASFIDDRLLKLHNPALYYDYGLDQYTPFASSEIKKTVNFKTRPKNTVSQKYRLGVLDQNFPLISGSSTVPGSIFSMTWTGADAEPFSVSERPLRIANLFGSIIGIRDYSPTAGNQLNLQIDKKLEPDPRNFYKTAVFNNTFIAGPATSFPAFNSPGETPYILFPEDNIILGIESIVPYASGSRTRFFNTGSVEQSYLEVTGSLHRILSGSAKITLYGSLIQNNQEKIFNSLNQNLVSPAIHELVFDPAEDSDQFLISERYLYTGSYIDNFMSSGTILKGTRFVSASLTAENTPVGGLGSFERFVSLNNPDEIYYDCLAVDGRTLDSEDSAFSYVPVSDKFTPVLGAGGNNLFQTDGNLRPNFPYRSGKIRIINTPTLSISSTNYTGKNFKTAFFYTGKNQYSNFPYDIRPFFSSSSPGSNYVAYGMLNVENQQPKNVFRPDRYGQMRDMLEQPFDGITYKLTGKVGPTTQPVQILFVSASSEVVVDPALTNSNNLSEHATSSLPYFDGLNLSRSTPFPTSSLGPFVPTSIVFQT